MRNKNFDASFGPMGMAARPDQNVGPLSGTFGLTVMSENCFQKLRGP